MRILSLIRTAPRRLAVSVILGAAVLVAGALPAGAAWPVASTSSWVSRGYTTSHRAYDIAASRWTRLVPVQTGTVVFAGWKANCGGYQVWIRHTNGWYTAYYHLAREVVSRGQVVYGQRTTIGYVGSTGCSTGPHLHVELWKGFPWRSGSYRQNPWSRLDSGTYLPYRYR